MSFPRRRSASDFTSHQEMEDNNNPTIPELFSVLRDAFQASEFDRIEAALVAREENLKQQHKEALELDRLANDLKKPPPATVKKEEGSDEEKKVIWQLRKKNSRLEKDHSRLERELEALESRMIWLEDDTTKLANGMALGSNHSGGVVDVENVFDCLIASQANRNLQNSGEGKLDKVIEKQREEYALLEKKYKFEAQKMQKAENEYAVLKRKYLLQLEEKVKVENELKDCRVEIEGLKEELKAQEDKHMNEHEDIEQKHRIGLMKMLKLENKVKRLKEDQTVLKEKHKNEYKAHELKHQSDHLDMIKVENELRELKEERKVLQEKHKNEYKAVEQKQQSDFLEKLKVENALKVCKADLDKLKEEHKVIEEKHKNDRKALEQKHQSHLLKVESELKNCKAKLQGLKEEQNISSEKYEKLLQEVSKHRKDEDEMVNFNAQRKNEGIKSEPKVELKNEISSLDKFANVDHTASENMDGSRKQKCIVSPNHIINIVDCDSVPASCSLQGNGVGNSGTLKFSSAEPILLSDSDDDCAPLEPSSFGLKRKRASSPNGSDNNNGGHNFKQSFPTPENKQPRMLSRCVSEYGKQNNSRSRDQEILRTSEEKVSEKQKSSIESPAKVNGNADSSSTSSFSSDDSDSDIDISFQSTMLFTTNRS